MGIVKRAITQALCSALYFSVGLAAVHYLSARLMQVPPAPFYDSIPEQLSVWQVPDAEAEAVDAVEEDEVIALLYHSSLVHAVLGVVTFILLSYGGVLAPFGRHADRSRMPLRLSARLSWALQEMPTLLNVFYFIWIEVPITTNSKGESYNRSTVNTLALLFFVQHYIHRSIIYPLALPPSAHAVPLHVTLSAALYCLLNGRLQVLAALAASRQMAKFTSERGASDVWAAVKVARQASRDILLIVLRNTKGEDLRWRLASSALLLMVVGSVMLFLWGFSINITSDYHLLRLRKHRIEKERECQKKIKKAIFDEDSNDEESETESEAGEEEEEETVEKEEIGVSASGTGSAPSAQDVGVGDDGKEGGRSGPHPTVHTEYSIPYGRYFDLVSCPNFFGEIVEWIGYSAILYTSTALLLHVSSLSSRDDCTTFSLLRQALTQPAALAALAAGSSFALYTAANLLPRAAAHHRWYLATFGETYEALHRRRVIPLIY